MSECNIDNVGNVGNLDSSKGTAIVTGGAIRVGRIIALSLARDGYDVAIHCNSSLDKGREVVTLIEAMGRKSILFQADLSDANQLDYLIDDVANKFGDIKLLINNAAIFEREDFCNVDINCFDRHMNINLRAPFFLSQKFAKICDDGQIINILDTQIKRNTEAYFTYLLTKKSLYELTQMTAKKLAPNIRVNAICLGSLLPSQDWSADDIANQDSNLPLQKPLLEDNLTDSLAYLVNSDYLTGQFIYIDGGASVNL